MTRTNTQRISLMEKCHPTTAGPLEVTPRFAPGAIPLTQTRDGSFVMSMNVQNWAYVSTPGKIRDAATSEPRAYATV